MTVYTVLNQKVSQEIFNHFITVESEIHDLRCQLKQKDDEIKELKKELREWTKYED